MKHILLIIAIISVCVLGACKKNNSSSPVQMTAVIENRPWTSTGARITLDKATSLHLTITADSADTHMKLDIGNYTGVGTYVISDSGNTATYTSHSKAYGSALHTATSGQIKITEATTNGKDRNSFKGTFSFLADTVQVTAGAFDLNIYLN